MKIHPVGAEFSLQIDEGRERHDEANNRFRDFMNAPKEWASTQ
jgi:hypothetical protein